MKMNQNIKWLQYIQESWAWSWRCYNYAPCAQHLQRALIKTRCVWTDVHDISITFVIGIFSFCLYFTLAQQKMIRVCAVASKTQWQTTCKTIKKKNNKHFQENIFVSIHEGLLMNGIFIKFHFLRVNTMSAS